MRMPLIILLSVALITSCDWRPGEIQIESKATVENINLVLGDTVFIQIEGSDFSLIEGLDNNIAEVIDIGDPLQDRVLEIIGIIPGELQLFFRYNLPQDIDSEISLASYLIQLRVTESISLSAHVGEKQILDFSDYLTNEQLNTLDSVAIINEEGNPRGKIDIDEMTGSLTELLLTGEVPGYAEVGISCYDSNNNQITALTFRIEISIQKIVLAELITNAGCPGCPEANDHLDINIDTYASDLAVIRYHVWWPSTDPMFDFSAERVEERYFYYSPPYLIAPTLLIDGSSQGSDVSSEGWSVKINQQSGEQVDVHIWEATADNTTDSMFVNYRIQNFGASLANVHVWSVLTQDSIYYAGTNGESNHNQVMRDMSSTSISILGSNFLVQHALHIPSDFGISEDFNLVVIIQNDSDKKVIQSRVFNLPDMFSSMVF
ncbi:MAG: hypothetical protein HQ508_01455 [Candidatus Marinimicrobia bacterium]|nr:hypothetical protein [Candidatus Neomarinimicrobiota bacterium]